VSQQKREGRFLGKAAKFILRTSILTAIILVVAGMAAMDLHLRASFAR